MTATLTWPAPDLAGLRLRRDGVARAAAREESLAEAAAFSELVAREKERVFRVALSVLGPGGEAEAEDVTQEAFVRIYRSLPSFRGESRLSTWVYRLTFNLALPYAALRRAGVSWTAVLRRALGG